MAGFHTDGHGILLCSWAAPQCPSHSIRTGAAVFTNRTACLYIYILHLLLAPPSLPRPLISSWTYGTWTTTKSVLPSGGKDKPASISPTSRKCIYVGYPRTETFAEQLRWYPLHYFSHWRWRPGTGIFPSDVKVHNLIIWCWGPTSSPLTVEIIVWVFLTRFELVFFRLHGKIKWPNFLASTTIRWHIRTGLLDSDCAHPDSSGILCSLHSRS